MTGDEQKAIAALYRRVRGEISDDLDEERELEIDDERLAKSLDDAVDHPPAETNSRRF